MKSVKTMAWLELILSHPLGFLQDLGLYLLVAAGFLSLSLFLLSRWFNYADQAIAERTFLDESRRQSEHMRLVSLNRYLKRVLVILAIALLLGFIALDYNIPLLGEVAASVKSWLVSGGIFSLLRIAMLAVVCFAVLAIVRRSARVLVPATGQRFERDVARASTLRSVTESTVRVLLVAFFGLYTLSELGAPIGTFLTGLGILGLAVSFGAQSLVKDLISGFFILAEDQFGVGDVVKIGELSGDVEAITLRTTTLRDIEGCVHIIPNGQIDKVTVMTKGWSRSVLDIDVAYETDLDRALSVLSDEAQQMYQDQDWSWRILESPQPLGVQDLAQSSITLRLLIKTLPKEQWAVAREFRKRIKARFDQERIEIPYPHLKLYVADDAAKKEDARPKQ